MSDGNEVSHFESQFLTDLSELGWRPHARWAPAWWRQAQATADSVQKLGTGRWALAWGSAGPGSAHSVPYFTGSGLNGGPRLYHFFLKTSLNNHFFLTTTPACTHTRRQRGIHANRRTVTRQPPLPPPRLLCKMGRKYLQCLQIDLLCLPIQTNTWGYMLIKAHTYTYIPLSMCWRSKYWWLKDTNGYLLIHTDTSRYLPLKNTYMIPSHTYDTYLHREYLRIVK